MITGDERVNEQPGLTAIHTLFHFEHNRLVRELAKFYLCKIGYPFSPQYIEHFLQTAPAHLQERIYQVRSRSRPVNRINGHNEGRRLWKLLCRTMVMIKVPKAQHNAYMWIFVCAYHFIYSRREEKTAGQKLLLCSLIAIRARQKKMPFPLSI
jgi:hypothetical protein